jgi:predicted ATP-grasp superfamily ATP-dependent carboligase
MRILLTSSRALIAPAVIRNFTSYGHEVITADSMRFGAGSSSNKRLKHIRIPSCRFAEDIFIHKINDIVEDEKIDIIIPLAEEGFYIAKHRNELKCNCLVEGIKKIEQLHNKMAFYELCVNAGIKTPYTEMASKFIKGKVYKRIFSRCGESTTLSCKDTDLLHDEWIMQDFIEGTPISSFTVGENTVVYKAKFHNGMEPFSNLYTIDDDIIQRQITHIVEIIRSRTGYNGVMGLDFILTPSKGLYCIECNPRITAGLLLMDKADLLNILLQQTEKADTKGEARKFIGHMFWQFLSGEVNFINIKNYLSAMWNFKETVFDIKDIKPYLTSYLMNLEWIWIAIKHKIHIKEATSYDIQYNQSD